MKTNAAAILFLLGLIADVHAGRDEQQIDFFTSMAQMAQSFSCAMLEENCGSDSPDETGIPKVIYVRMQPPRIELTDEQKNELRLRSQYELQILEEKDEYFPEAELNGVCERYLELCEKYIEVQPCEESNIFTATSLMTKWIDANFGRFEI